MAPAPGGPGKVRGRAAAGVFMVPRSPRPGRYIHACFRTRGARVGRAAPMKAAVGRSGERRADEPAPTPAPGCQTGARCPGCGVGSAVPGAPSPVPGARRRAVRPRYPVPVLGCVRELYPVPVFGTRSRCSLLRGRYPATPRGDGAARRVPMGRSHRAGPPRVLALTMGSGGAAAPLMGRPERRRRRACPSRPGLARRVAAPRPRAQRTGLGELPVRGGARPGIVRDSSRRTEGAGDGDSPGSPGIARGSGV
ncbi:translation initiation factor IF-2-like [Aquila chrysaetos chrysaetos]|uniref:translation initiation factor IF-2-like n=1 Tax=Aquila chrysaetos chrysaetos TaxID=223781 RepID=UPI0011769657|nr:translation initiation factor IF-2-like [Aquila chrysaetos chrysaetos]